MYTYIHICTYIVYKCIEYIIYVFTVKVKKNKNMKGKVKIKKEREREEGREWGREEERNMQWITRKCKKSFKQEGN